MPQVDPELAAALHRFSAAFGLVEVLEVVDHRDGQDQPATIRRPSGDRPTGGR